MCGQPIPINNPAAYRGYERVSNSLGHTPPHTPPSQKSYHGGVGGHPEGVNGSKYVSPNAAANHG